MKKKPDEIELTGEQNEALRKMLDSNSNIFLTGSAGTGKTVLVKSFKEKCGKRIVSLGPTGLSALAIGGETIHHFFGMYPLDIFHPKLVRTFCNDGLARLVSNVDLIIIEEISLVRSDLFNAIDIMLRAMASGEREGKPFGGVRILTVGDFNQLEPVVPNDTAIILDNDFGGKYAFQTEAWKKGGFEVINLREIHRQKDPLFLDALDCVRTKNLSRNFNNESPNLPFKNCLDLINERCVKAISTYDSSGTTLCPTKKLVKIANERASRNLQGRKGCSSKGRVSGEFPRKVLPTDIDLFVSIGMPVILVANKYTPTGDLYHANGATGTVVDIIPNKLIVQLKRDGKLIEVERHSWLSQKYELVRDADDKEILRQRVTGFYKQLPILQAFSLTIHRAQGLTLDDLRLTLGNYDCFGSGMLYTALSRCRSLARLTINRPLREADIKADPDVLEFYKSLP